MKEMIYETKMHNPEVLESNTHNGFNYLVVSYGTHPCCYVEIPPTHPLYEKTYDLDECRAIDCHCGLTFSDFRDFGEGKQWYIGWDYHHYCDYSGIYNLPQLQEFDHSQDKKWTTEEMIEECKEVINQVQAIFEVER